MRMGSCVSRALSVFGLALLAACGGGGGSGGTPNGEDPYVYDGPEDIVFLLPYEAPPPAAERVHYVVEYTKLDVYLLLDISGSMSAELGAIEANLSDALDGILCPPAGTGTEGQCISSLYVGVGALGTINGTAAPYEHVVDVGPSLPSTFPAVDLSGTQEAHMAALWSAVTGQEPSESGCVELMGAASAGLCTAGGRGGVCFRPDSLAVVILATDEAPTESVNCPSIHMTADAVDAIGAHVVGVLGSGAPAQARTDLELLATLTDSVDDEGQPLVVDGADAQAPAAIQSALQALLDGVLVTLHPEIVDEPSDAGDATQFFDRFAAVQAAEQGCSTGLATSDANADGVAETFVDVPTSTPLCWDLEVLTNTTVPQTTEAQVYKARVELRTDANVLLATITVAFVVPPAP